MKPLWLLICLFHSSIFCIHKPIIDEGKCPDGWDHIPHNNHCYLLVNRPMPQNLAEKYCSLLSDHSHLARVRNREQNDFLQEYAYSTERIWVEAKAKFDIIDSRASLYSPGLVLRWKNGNPVVYANWKQDNGFDQLSLKKLCVLMDRHGKWLNADCTQAENFVCEMKSPDSAKSQDSTLSLKCPPNWSFNVKTSACYRILSQENISWLEADKLCAEEGAKHGEEIALASVHSHGENKFLLELGKKEFSQYEYIMLGAIGHSTNANQWDWIDGSSFALFSNWQENKPSGSRNSAVLFMRPNGEWFNWYADRRFEKRGSALAVCKFLVG